MNMKLRYRSFLRRKSVHYAFDDSTKTFTSLKTKDKAEAHPWQLGKFVGAQKVYNEEGGFKIGVVKHQNTSRLGLEHASTWFYASSTYQ